VRERFVNKRLSSIRLLETVLKLLSSGRGEEKGIRAFGPQDVGASLKFVDVWWVRLFLSAVVGILNLGSETVVVAHGTQGLSAQETGAWLFKRKVGCTETFDDQPTFQTPPADKCLFASSVLTGSVH
jgi:hypothetical protein